MKKDKITGNGYTMENQSFKQLVKKLNPRCKIENIFRFYDNIVQLLKGCKVQLIYYLVIVKLKCCTVISYFLLQIPRENTYLG